MCDCYHTCENIHRWGEARGKKGVGWCALYYLAPLARFWSMPFGNHSGRASRDPFPRQEWLSPRVDAATCTICEGVVGTKTQFFPQRR